MFDPDVPLRSRMRPEDQLRDLSPHVLVNARSKGSVLEPPGESLGPLYFERFGEA